VWASKIVSWPSEVRWQRGGTKAQSFNRAVLGRLALVIVVKGNGPLSRVTTKGRETKREGWRGGRKQTSFLFSRHSQEREEGDYLTEERGEGFPLETRERERERERERS
jgi:hypothetical protein